MAEDMILVTRKGGIAGLDQNQRKCFKGLGLNKNYKSVLIKDTNASRGLVNKVIHKVEAQLVPANEVAKFQKELNEQRQGNDPGYRIIPKK